ncbi:MAG TPA: hemerythrin domain-containing protein [Candidatus Limnocylindrales bacterium]|nr:hemerythrin domain-containing protein [Candidatus Limnocylindrales bacterium]
MSTQVGDDVVWAFAESEHRDLGRGISRISELTESLGQGRTPVPTARTREVLGWLHSILEPHFAWEEAALYPEVDARAGTPWATRAARLSHQQMRARIARLEAAWMPLPDQARRGRPTRALVDLVALEALLRAHLELEEDVLFPVLTGSDVQPAARDAGESAKPE